MSETTSNNANESPRRRISVTTEVANDIPLLNTEDNVNKFNPQQFSKLRLPPAPIKDKTAAIPEKTFTIEDIAAAFARAGQPAPKMRNIAEPPINKPAAEIPDAIPTEHDQLTNNRITTALPNDNPFASREILPSNSVFYDYPALSLAPLDVPQYARLYKARRENDESGLIDVVNAACSIDVRDLTVKDFRYLLYKLRTMSSLKAPYKLSYTSAYGNRNDFTVTSTNLQVGILQAKAAEYEDYLLRGFIMPTLRDQEEFNSLQRSLAIEGEFYWGYAKYVAGSDVKDKIANLQTLPLRLGILAADLFAEIDLFAKKFEDYGVTESVELLDKQFKAEPALIKLRADVANIDNMLNGTLEAGFVNSLITRREDLTTDITRIETELANKGEAAPKRETIEFSIAIADFFPAV